MFEPGHHLRHELVGEFQHPLAGLARVDADFFHAVADEIAQYPQHQRQILIQRGDAAGLHDAFLDGAPQALQELHVGPQRPGLRAFGGSAHDIAAAEFGAKGVDHFLQALPLALAVDLDRDARDIGIGQKHQKAGRQGDVRGQPRPFGADGVLDDLHHPLLTFAHQFGDGRRPFAVGTVDAVRGFGEGFGPDVRHVQKGGPVQSDIHERRFHAGQDPRDATLVDVADQAAPAGPLD